jgi:HEAT repeat protein
MSRRSRTPRALHAWLTLGCCAALLCLATPASARSRQDAAFEVERLLAEPSAADDLPRRLAAIGPSAVLPLFHALAGTGEREPLAAPRRELALGALELLPCSAVLGALEANVGPEATRPQRSAALEIVGRTGQRADVALLVRYATPPPGSEERELDVERAFESAASDWLDRNPEAVALLAAEWSAVPPALWIPLARQLGAALSPSQLDTLTDQLGRAPGADGLLLGEIERLAARASSAMRRQIRPAVRPMLDEEDPLVCIAACRAVRELEDSEAVHALIQLLSAEEEAVRSSALEALQGLTRQSLGPEPEAWNAWYAGELAWWQGAAQRHLTALGMGLKLEIVPAMLGLARGVLFREEIAPALFGFLQHSDRDVARLAASVLGSLGSRLAVPALAESLSSKDRAVAAAAHKALRQIAGRDLGPEAQEWLALPH